MDRTGNRKDAASPSFAGPQLVKHEAFLAFLPSDLTFIVSLEKLATGESVTHYQAFLGSEQVR